MARAYGWNSKLLLAWETSYGTAPSSANSYQIVPFISSSLDSEQGLIESRVLGQGRDPTAPFQDVITVDGDIVVPMDLNNIGYWLKALFGVATTTTKNTTKKTHKFVSGKKTVPNMTLEVGLLDVSKYLLVSGVRANSIALNFQRSGESQATINVIGQGISVGGSTKKSSSTAHAYTRFSQFQGNIKQGSNLLANVTSGSLTYSNNLERIETIRSDGKIDGVDLGMATLTGSIAVRYTDETLMNVASGGTGVALTFTYEIDAENLLEITAHEVYLPKPKRTIEGPGGIEVSYDFQGAKNTTAGKMLTVT